MSARSSTTYSRAIGVRAAMVGIIGLLCIPLIVMLVFSFNRPSTRFNYELNKFSAQAWLHPLAVPQLGLALRNSLIVAVVSSLLAVLIGTPMGIGLGRFRFRGKSALTGFTFIPLATPEVVIGAGLLTIFVASALVPFMKSLIPSGILFPLGFPTLIIAHTTLGVSFVVVTVRSRVVGLPTSYEEAARDLGASSFTAFRTVMLPLILPGIVSGGLLVFAVSLDDFVLTNFTAGGTQMFPTWIYSLMRRRLPPQIDVVGLLLFALVLLSLLSASILSSLIKRRRLEVPR
jgi:spermidine/putrescine transport system permease protein